MASPFNYIGSGAPTFGGPAAAPALYLDRVGRVVYTWDGTSGLWVPLVGTNSVATGLTAAGANKGNSLQVTGTPTAVNVTTTAAGTGIALPASWVGAEITVANNGANALLVYTNQGLTETINALGTTVGFSVAPATINIFYCFAQGQWSTK